MAKRLTRGEFIEKACKKHGYKYDYSKVEYIDSKTKVRIICPEHGEFWQNPHNHLNGSKCPQCSKKLKTKKIKYTCETFTEKANKKHNFKYDYSEVIYIDSQTNVCIICPEHGKFYQTPANHLRGNICPKCSNKQVGEKNTISNEDYIKRAKEVHGDIYDYSETVYKGMKEDICIICPKHGKFWQNAHSHVYGRGCPKCGNEKNAENLRMGVSEFIDKSNKKHHFKYDYSKVEYIDSKTKVRIICPEHGEFWQTPSSHLNGRGCPKCGNEKNAENLRMSIKEFITKAQEVHGDKYDYSKVEYVNTKTKVCIICPEHGEFEQTPSNHLNQKQGCPRCNESHLERDVNELLVESGISFETQKKFKGLGKQSCDFYIPSLNTIIECQGRQHFEYVNAFHKKEGFKMQQKRDLNKYNFAIKNGYKIVYYCDIEKYDTFLGEPLIKDLDTLKSVLITFNK